MPSSIATSERKRKSTNNKKHSKSFDDNKHELEESFSDNDAIESHNQDTDEEEQYNSQSSDESDNDGTEKENIQEIANEATEQVKGDINRIVDSDSEEENEDGDALTTMNAIMEYNKILVQRLQKLEASTGSLKKSDVQDTVKNTLDDVSAKYSKEEESSGTHHSFELPVSDMMKGYGCFSTEPVSDDKDDTKKSDDGEDTIKDGDDNIVREKDDIVVKVEATKTGITFSIHIPRS